MSVFEFFLIIVVDVPTTLLIRRYFCSVKSGVFLVVLAYIHAVLVGGFYITLLKSDDVFFVKIEHGDNFFRDLIFISVGVFVMVMFHGWSVSSRYR
ncbi:hypothetical protein [Pseudomonas sichuanensis]|uniref:hypothetical protein n=1 Tax=Pseudomonas sichuanensis TaxID=2213015 RepID=UPI0021602538|nr:hypothetical protein [Pseudomonas sichuanensis]MDZ4017329.1 hypothetical protein [Pseudomonas sichuanensis]UVL91116.1 hypothetical protein LOY51_09635 [Pseudomonas sichuanensis]